MFVSGTINLGYLSTGQLGPLPGQNPMSMQTGGPVGVIGGHLNSQQANGLPSPAARRESFSFVDVNRRTSVHQMYPGVMGNYNSLTINTPLANMNSNNSNEYSGSRNRA